jgi:membrane associated rhomboid family serine protease
MFLHGGWLHLIGNMVVLWVFGNSMEEALGAPDVICSCIFIAELRRR